jgi:hypothetical protein
MIAEAGGFGGAGAGFLAHQRVELQRQCAFGVGGIAGMQFLRDDQAEHAIAEEFETLIGSLCVGAGMGQRAAKQIAVAEDMPEALFEISR